ncbi:MAG: PIN domain-containing protein [Pseudonocardiaceae bacterium]
MNVLELRAGATGERAIETLRQAAMDAGHLGSAAPGRTGAQVLDRYLSWAEDAERMLGNVLDPETVTDVIHTPRYWSLRTATGETPRLTPLVLAEAADALRRERDRWRSHAAILVVPDTNMFLQQDAPFEQIDWPVAIDSRIDVRIVLPLVVVHELDRLKRQGNNTTSKLARSALRWLAANLPTDPNGRSAKLSAGHPETTVEVYVQDGPTRPEDADGLIIRFAKQLGTVAEMQTKLVTHDLGMRLRARALGVEAVQLPDP